MYRRVITAAMATVLSLSVAGSLQAAPVNPFHHAPATEKAASGKMVSFSVRNDSKATLVLKAGEQQYTIEPGKTAGFKLQEGAELVNVSGTEKQAAGSVLMKVDKQLQGNTLAVS